MPDDKKTNIVRDDREASDINQFNSIDIEGDALL